MYLLDTDVLIDVLRGVDEAREFLIGVVERGAFISTVTIAELFSGRETRDPIKKEKITRLLSHFEALPVTPEVAMLAGEIRRDYQVSLGDAIIAATAAVHGLTVVTGNIKHFARIEGISVLKPPYR
ncbi:type II toxin-antitoxin system VapC family toxin [Thermococcus gorgonarius]|uniref:Ribonuclease VapC n=1 Tax=Thermococcus gorgonarius TaxID=71997 RepID=A0A2Z2M3T6_THEGO|nr:type II toxin-antitoxin system VapC family toxin [Thermococcus gorgonarius]ASJ00400.1 nucleotide-binding protein [Thermococcus gorgonarius]